MRFHSAFRRAHRLVVGGGLVLLTALGVAESAHAEPANKFPDASLIRPFVRPTFYSVKRAAFAYHGEISGQVRYKDGRPIAGVRVRAWFFAYGSYVPDQSNAITDAHGDYHILGLTAQKYFVQVESPNAPYLPYVPEPAHAIDLNALPGNVARVDFTLRLGPEILVRVHDAETGAPVSNVSVNAFSEYFNHSERIGKTNEKGEFRFRANRSPMPLRLGEEYQWTPEALPPGAKDYPAPGFGFWNTIDWKHSDSRVWDVKTYKNAFAHVAATFHGVVYNSAGKPAGSATVRLLRDNIEQTVTTDAQGQFAFRTTRLRPGEERAAIVRARSGSDSAFVYPTPEQTWSVIPVFLRPDKPSAVTGVVIDENGAPQSGVAVRYFEFFPQSSAMTSISARAGGVTDAVGRFTVSGLTFEADYRFEFGGQTRDDPNSPWARTTLPETNAIPSSLILGTRPITVNPGQTRDLGHVVVLRASRTLSGKISMQGGPLPPHLLVVVRGAHTNALAFPDANGSFSVGFIPHEPVSITVHQSDDGRAWDTSYNFVYAKPALFSGDIKENQTEVQIILPEKKP